MTENSNIDLKENEVKATTDIKQGLMSRFNNTNVFGIDTTNFKYIDLKELFDTACADTSNLLNFYFPRLC